MKYIIKILDEDTGYEKLLNITEPMLITNQDLLFWGFHPENDIVIITMEPKGEIAPVDFEDSDFREDDPFTWPSLSFKDIDSILINNGGLN